MREFKSYHLVTVKFRARQGVPMGGRCFQPVHLEVCIKMEASCHFQGKGISPTS